MRVRNEEEYQRKKNDIMEKCFDCYAEHGLGSIGIKGLAEAQIFICILKTWMI